MLPRNLPNDQRSNIVEVYDLSNDPGDMNNLAADRAANASLIMTMNGKREAVIKAENGKDDGREMPDVPNITWASTGSTSRHPPTIA